MSITIKRPIVVKVKVTEGFKKQMAREIQDSLLKIDTEIQNIDFQLKRMVAELEKKNPQGIPAARQHLENEKNKRINAKGKLNEQIKTLGKIAIGSEMVQGTLESFTEINVGDDWEDIMGVEVLVCDNKIIDIRRRKINSDG